MTDQPRFVEVVPYDHRWPQMFEVEAAAVKRALGDNCIRVHHIGSTSVPGLAAKPLIDMIPVVRDIAQVDQANEAMVALGYAAKGEYGLPLRRFFQKGDAVKTHNVHVYEEGNPEIDRHLRFRDWMRTHPEGRQAYGALKQSLAVQFPQDIMSYWLGKEDFIAQIDARAGAVAPRIVACLTPREWEAYHQIRKVQIFDPIGVPYDPHHPTITDPAHHHFILYHGPGIVSAAHVELLNEHEAALRSLATDAPFQRQGYGTQAMGILERWLRSHGRSVFKMHARLSAEDFYRKLGYGEMPFDDPCIQEHFIDMGKVL